MIRLPLPVVKIIFLFSFSLWNKVMDGLVCLFAVACSLPDQLSVCLAFHYGMEQLMDLFVCLWLPVLYLMNFPSVFLHYGLKQLIVWCICLPLSVLYWVKVCVWFVIHYRIKYLMDLFICCHFLFLQDQLSKFCLIFHFGIKYLIYLFICLPLPVTYLINCFISFSPSNKVIDGFIA